MAPGRPRTFDRDTALVKAMILFWEQGYQDTSIAELTDRLGIASPSLYAAFGSKSALFCEAADRYQRVEGAQPGIELETAPTALVGIERLLRANVVLFTRRRTPRGCMLTRATLTCPPEDREVSSYLDRCRRERLEAIEARLTRALGDGEPLAAQDVTAFAHHVDATVQGLAVKALEGTSRRTLDAVIDLFVDPWRPSQHGRAHPPGASELG